MDYRISKEASAAFGALSNVLQNKHVPNHLKGEVCKVVKSLFYLLRFVGVRFGAYEKTYSIIQPTPKLP